MSQRLYFIVFMFLCFSPLLFAKCGPNPGYPNWITKITPTSCPNTRLIAGQRMTANVTNTGQIRQVNFFEEINGKKERLLWLRRENITFLPTGGKSGVMGFTIPHFGSGTPHNNELWVQIKREISRPFQAPEKEYYMSKFPYTYVRSAR